MRWLWVFLLFALLPLNARAAQIITDDLGRRVTLPRPPQRIVSLAPSVTEILYAVGAGRKIVGDTVFCDFPPAAKRLPHVGGPITPSAEKILALHPDLIILADQTLPASEADSLAAHWQTPVYVTAAATYAGVERNIAALGMLVGQVQATQQTLQQMQRTESAVRRAVAGQARPHVFVVVWEKPLMTAGGGSFIGDLIRLAGGINIAEHSLERYPSYSPERLLREQPDIVLTGINYSTLTFPGADALTSLKQRHVFAVTGDWTDRPGPRLGLGLLAVAKALHPEGFGKGLQK